MKLVITRHGEAGNALIDSDRQLTTRGYHDLNRQTCHLNGCGWKFTDIRCSPVLRARQTAESIAKNYKFHSGMNLEVHAEKALSPGFIIEDAVELLQYYSQSDSSIWVFHAPDVIRLSSYLLGLSESAFYFPPGAMIGLNLPLPVVKGRSMLIWMLQPEFLENVIPISES